MMDSIRWAVERNPEAAGRVEVLSCHGESTPEEQDEIHRPLREGQIRFVCATEVVRTSVTVRETIGVIDSLQVKRLITDAKGVAHLTKVAVSKAEAEQAKGRAGRTQPGFYIPVSFEMEYENLAPYPQPAILREPLTNVALQVADIRRSIRDFPFIDRPDAEKVEVALTRLRRLGALDGKEKITELGELLLQFPVDPERAKTLVTADRLGVLSEAVVVTATLETEGFFMRLKESKLTVDEDMLRFVLARFERVESSWEPWRRLDTPRSEEEVDIEDLPSWVTWTVEGYELNGNDMPYGSNLRWLSDELRRFWASGTASDYVAIVRAYRAFKAEERRLREDRKLSGGQREAVLRRWCFARFINFKRIRMAEDSMYQIREELASSPLHLENGLATEREFSSEALSKALASGGIDDVAVRGGSSTFTGPHGDFELGYQSVCPTDSKLILIGGIHKIPAGRRRDGFILLADLAAPLKPEWLSEVMPQLVSSERQGDHHYVPERDVVEETCLQRFIELQIKGESVETQDRSAASDALASWLASQSV